jgi:hypothetical protein
MEVELLIYMLSAGGDRIQIVLIQTTNTPLWTFTLFPESYLVSLMTGVVFCRLSQSKVIAKLW